MFIKTSYEETANILRKENFTELPKEGNYWVFVNDGKANFSNEELKDKKIIYTNKLFI